MSEARKCRWCGKKLAERSGTGRPFWYCSVACQTAARRKRDRDRQRAIAEKNAVRSKVCPICGTRFHTRDGHRMRKYCSPACAHVGELEHRRAFYDRVRKPMMKKSPTAAAKARERAGIPPVVQPKTYAEIRAENRKRQFAAGWREGSVHVMGGGPSPRQQIFVEVRI